MCGILAGFALSASVAAAKDETTITVSPGPMAMSASESAIDVDPARGFEDGVILIEETDRDESFRTRNEVSYHLRAKILSADGRGLADVTIPFNSENTKLKRWWGRTIHPDGTVHELAESELEEQVLAKTSGAEYSVLKGSLPRVEPGCVIDYGYEVRVEGFIPPAPVALERAWPMIEFRYRWVPWQGFTAAYYVTGGGRVPAEVVRNDDAVLAEVRDTQPVVEEPLDPPDSAIRAMLYLYYTDATGNIEEYWHDKAKRLHDMTEDFAGSEKKRRKLLAEIGIEPTGNLDADLRRLYWWISTEMDNVSLRSYEEDRAASSDEDYPLNAKEAIKLGRGRATDVTLLFISLARSLGAEARLVLVPDRTTAFWQPQIYDMGQFDGMLVAIGSPEGQLSFLAPGYGLPYGAIPWWLSGVPAACADEGGMREVSVRPDQPQDNVSKTEATIEFDLFEGVMLVDWSQTATGNAGYVEKLRLRARDPKKREELLRALCAEGPDLEVIEAAAPELHDLNAGHRLQCSAESLTIGIDNSIDSLRVDVAGPWIRPLPDLTDESRVHPVHLDYPRIDETTWTIATPEDYTTVEPPAPVTVNSPIGRYSLTVTADPDGYPLTRSLTLAFLGISPADYPTLIAFLNAVRTGDQTQVEVARKAAS